MPPTVEIITVNVYFIFKKCYLNILDYLTFPETLIIFVFHSLTLLDLELNFR